MSSSWGAVEPGVEPSLAGSMVHIFSIALHIPQMKTIRNSPTMAFKAMCCSLIGFFRMRGCFEDN